MLARNVSRARRLAQVGCSVVACFFLAGLVFGFAALKPILIDAGVYADLCPDGITGCAAQDTRLNVLFVVATSTTNCASLPIGWFLDTVGPQIATITGATVFGAGALTFGIGHVGEYIDTYMIGYFLMALGSPALFLAQFHLSNAFPKRSGLVLGTITGAFDASSMPLVFFKQAYFALGSPSLHTFFTAYAVLPVLLVIQQLTIAPKETYELLSTDDDYSDDTVVPDAETPSTIRPSSRKERLEALAAASSTFSAFSAHRGLGMSSTAHGGAANMNSAFSRISSRLDVGVPQLSRRMSSAFSRIHYDIRDDEGDDVLAVVLEDKDGVVGAMFGRSVGDQITSKWFWAMEFVLVVHMTRINWYLATVQAQLVYYTHDAVLADRLTDAFTVLLPAAGLAMVPAVGWLLDHRPQVDVSLVMMLLGVVFGTLTLLPSTAAQLVGIGALVCFRPLFYTAISDYAAKVFGFETFGTVYGLGMTLSGAVGIVLNPLDRAVKGQLGGNYSPVNIVLLVLGVASTAVLAYRCSGKAEEGVLRLDADEDMA